MTLINNLLKPLSLPALLLPALIFCFSPIALADDVAIPVGQQGADKASLERPKAGMTAEKVEARFGAPLNRSAAVGKPPISKWEYPEYWVYFESDRVIDTVLKPMASETDTAAMPATSEPAPAATEPAPPAAAEAASPAPAIEPDAKPATDAAPLNDKPEDKPAK